MACRVVGHGDMTALVTLEDVTVSYDGHAAVHHLTGAVQAGSLTAVIGPNGAGKSTLLRAIVGLVAHGEGRIATTVSRREIAYLPQQADLDRRFPLCVLDVVQLGQWSDAGLFGGLGPAGRDRARAALTAVGLDGFESRRLASLSAGQFQRILFARVLVQDAQLILLDEPFAAVDAKTTNDLLTIIQRWHAERRTIVTVLHDYDQARRHFPETLLLAREAVAWGPTDQTLTSANLRRIGAMVEAWDEAAPVCALSVA
jgi:zinc/manganese transport system ATP-binding protein